MSRHIPTNEELREQLAQERKRLYELQDARRLLLAHGNAEEYQVVQVQIDDVIEEILHIQKKLHPMHNLGGCPHCGGIIHYGDNNVHCSNCGR